MTPQVLKPSLDLLQEEYVLVQAWKKTSSYIRYHNWYSDTLALDWATVNLPSFIKQIQERLKNPAKWENTPLRLVLAPKSQCWQIAESEKWETQEPISADNLRPLAHVDLGDQVVATALMLCLANQVETKQADPRLPIEDIESRKKISSYGNRLFCDEIDGKLYHRWGSSKLYRSYFEDYRSFVSRPTKIAEFIQKKNEGNVFIVEFDLSKFYDRVRPAILINEIRKIKWDENHVEFFNFLTKVLNWSWDPQDQNHIQSYSEKAKIANFNQIALPQGLVASGFFANIILLEFDETLRRKIGDEIIPGIHLEDACRYVDDIRIVVRSEQDESSTEVNNNISKWLESILETKTSGLKLTEGKNKIAEFGSSERPLVFQSIRMKRIQSAISGGFDAIGGTEILDSIQGLMRSQEKLDIKVDENNRHFSPLPDVRNETVVRFSAARFRTTYRSIRPLLEDYPAKEVESSSEQNLQKIYNPYSSLTKRDVDEHVRTFALDLIKRWIEDPSNVRLLRIGFDIWPDPKTLKKIIELLRSVIYDDSEARDNLQKKQVAWYCLAELLKAGATETGFVDDIECLPKEIDLTRYRKLLCGIAKQIIEESSLINIPWYVQQQAFLYLATFDPYAVSISHQKLATDISHYSQLILFLKGNSNDLSSSDIATLSILARRSFSNKDNSIRLIQSILSSDLKAEITIRDPAFALELSDIDECFFDDLPIHIGEDFLCMDEADAIHCRSLASIVLMNDLENPFSSSFFLRNELSLLRFSSKFLAGIKDSSFDTITPKNVIVKLEDDGSIAKINSLQISNTERTSENSLYAPPDWCEPDWRWRFHLGFLLRFILCQHPNFTTIVPSAYWKNRSDIYRPIKSHWFQRRYGFFNEQSAFGNDWLPITDWMEQFLSALLQWPGCHVSDNFDWVKNGIERVLKEIDTRIEFLERKRVYSNKYQKVTETLILPMKISPPVSMFANRSLRACVVQTIIPNDIDRCDLACSHPDIRKRHRNHLSSALAAVDRMLALRKTHMDGDDRLDLLILPELAVHPDDIQTHLVPFA